MPNATATKKKSVKKGAAKKPVSTATHKWDKLLDGKKHTIKKGTDFTCTEQSFTVYCRSRARKQGQTVSILRVEDGVLSVQAFGTPKKAKPNAKKAG